MAQRSRIASLPGHRVVAKPSAGRRPRRHVKAIMGSAAAGGRGGPRVSARGSRDQRTAPYRLTASAFVTPRDADRWPGGRMGLDGRTGARDAEMGDMAIFGVDSAYDRLRIRALRVLPPGRARDDDRRGVFTAALGQFDELLDAAAAVGPASRRRRADRRAIWSRGSTRGPIPKPAGRPRSRNATRRDCRRRARSSRRSPLLRASGAFVGEEHLVDVLGLLEAVEVIQRRRERR